MRFLPETPECWPLLPQEGQLPNETMPEILARFGMGEYSVATIQLHATIEEAEEERKLFAIIDRTRPLAIANAPANPGTTERGATPSQPRPPLRVETAATGLRAPQRPPSRAPEAVGAHDPWAEAALAATERHRRPELSPAEDHTDAADKTADHRCGRADGRGSPREDWYPHVGPIPLPPHR